MSQSYPDRSIEPQPIGSTRMRGQSTTSWPSSAMRDARGSAWPGARVTTTLIFRQRAPGARGQARRDRRRDGARSSAPSSSAMSASSTSPSWYAATGARQPPPTAATHARSAATLRRVSASSAAATSSSSPSRTWSASEPWPASGSTSAGSNRWPTSISRPSRSRPQAARTIASRPRSERLARRVSMFPRSGSMDSEGSSASSCARRRADAVPIRIPGARRSLPTSASRASSRGGYAPTTSPAVSVDVMSFAE